MFSETLSIKVAEIGKTLEKIATYPLPLSREDVDTLKKLKSQLAKLSRDLEKELEKPTLQYKKDIDKLNQKIMDKILPQILRPCKFDLKEVAKYSAKAQDSISQINEQLDICFREISKCQGIVGKVRKVLQSLDLPNEIDSATKQVHKVAKELTSLNDQLLCTPLAAEHYPQEILHLYKALNSLKIQSESIRTSNTPKPNT